MMKNVDKAPFPWFGGKRHAADLVWRLIGDVPHYVEPFYGSGAVLLNRPHPANRPHYSETVNDLDGFVVNFWRAVQWYPDDVAHAASWPVSEADKSARQIALLRWRDGTLDRLAGDACWCDPVMAGWWAWVLSIQIGVFDGRGGWTADPSTGKIYSQPRGTTREPGVDRSLPQVGNNGQGVNHPRTREPGVVRNLPRVGSNGQGVNHPGTRELGVLDVPTAEHGRSRLDTVDWGAAYHDLTMPELIRWLRHLAARLRHVRILNGDWSRLVTTGAAHTLPVRQGHGPCGVFLDPPYANTADRTESMYMHDSLTVAHDVRAWCLANGDNPLFRIVLAGFEGEHGSALVDAGWTEHEWFVEGFMRGGMGNINRSGKKHQMHRDRLWASPYCLPIAPQATARQASMFGEDDV